MKRQSLTDDSGRWFDLDKAEKFEEDTFWDGRNRISKATGSQWNHEVIYRTASGLWVKNAWSQWQGSHESWTEISHTESAAWLIANGHEPHEELAEAVNQLEM